MTKMKGRSRVFLKFTPQRPSSNDGPSAGGTVFPLATHQVFFENCPELLARSFLRHFCSGVIPWSSSALRLFFGLGLTASRASLFTAASHVGGFAPWEPCSHEFSYLHASLTNYVLMLDPLRQYLSRYVPLSNEEFAFLADKLVIRSFDKKAQLVKVGEVETSLNFIVKGLLRKFFYRDKTEVITQIAREGDIISSSASFLSGTPSPYIVETIEPATVFSISRKHLEKLYDSSPRIERIGRMVITDLFLQKEEWEHESIRMDTRERFLHFVQDNPDLLQRVPQKYLASYLNMKPETFSRLKHLLYRRPTAASVKPLSSARKK